MKVILLGDTCAGKTSIVNRLVFDKFYEETESTIGAAFSMIAYKNKIFNVWDTAGQERYASLLPMYYRNANIAIYVYDVTKQHDESNSRLITLMHDNPSCTIIFIANKCDLIPKDELDQTMKRLERYEHIVFSAKTGEGIIELLERMDKAIEPEFPKKPIDLDYDDRSCC